MADIKFSEFPKATTSKDSDELAILQDGVNKMIASPILESKIINKTVSRVIQQGGASLNVVNLKGVVPTYADLATITPTPQLNDAYQVEADGLVYVYTEDGFQADGDGFVVQPEPIGIVEEDNQNAVSGGNVYESLKPFKDAIDTKEVFEVKLDSGFSGDIDYEDGTFSGWGQIIGKVQNFNSVYLPKIKFTQPSYPITQIAILIRENSFTGAVLHEEYLPFTGLINVENDFLFTFPNIENSSNSDIWVEIRTNGRLARTNAVSATDPMFMAQNPIDINIRFASWGQYVSDGVGFYIQAGNIKEMPTPTDDFLKSINSSIDANMMGESGKKYVIAAANIRTPYYAGGNFALHNDAGHEPCNISWVATADGDLRIGMSFNAKKVITMNVTPHVSLRSAGYEVATTGGLNIHAVVFYKDGVKVNAETLALPDCSLWFYGLFLVE